MVFSTTLHIWLDLTGVIADLNFPFPAGSGVTFRGHVYSRQRDSRYAHPGPQPLSAQENKTASCGSPFFPAHLLRQSWTQSHNTALTPPNTPASPGITTPLSPSHAGYWGRAVLCSMVWCIFFSFNKTYLTARLH